MEKRNDGWYRADKGFHFVLTEKGKKEVASYSGKTVGEPVDEYDYEATGWAVKEGYVIEVPIPDWITKEGYKVVCNYNGYTLSAGNPVIFPERELAEKYMEKYNERHYVEQKLYIADTVYEGRALKECRVFNGKKVYNKDWYYGTNALRIGDYVEQEIVDDVINCLPPACTRSDCVQLGEAASERIAKDGNRRTTYETFKKVSDDVWEYCGDCFRGENVQYGKCR